MIWTNGHEVLLCSEVLLMDPFQFKPSTRERGAVWEAIASYLNSIDAIDVKFKEVSETNFCICYRSISKQRESWREKVVSKLKLQS